MTTVTPYEKEIIDMLYDLGLTFSYALAGKKNWVSQDPPQN